MIAQKLKGFAKLKVIAAIAELRRRLLGTHAVAIVGATSNGLFAVDPEDSGVGRLVLRDGEYGQSELELLYNYLRPEFKVLVVGAHIGTVAIPIAKRVKEVYAIEANPRTFQLLTMNVALHKLDNITAAQIAASDKRETLSFLMSRVNSGGSKRVPVVHDFSYYYDRPETVSVDAVPLDEYVPGVFDAIIMDIEGSEMFALAGMPNLLSAAQMLQVEFLSHHLKNVSNVTVSQFLSVVEPYFSKLFIPSKNLTVSKDKFGEVLQNIYDAGEGDNGIIFTKA